MNTEHTGSRKDYFFGIAAGFFIGLFLIPILKTTNPDIFEQLKYILVPVFMVLVPIGLVIASWISQKSLSFGNSQNFWLLAYLIPWSILECLLSCFLSLPSLALL
jgi:hypothetical protein